MKNLVIKLWGVIKRIAFRIFRDNKTYIINWVFLFIDKRLSEFVRKTDNKIDDRAYRFFHRRYAKEILKFIDSVSLPNKQIVKKINKLESGVSNKLELGYTPKTQSINLDFGGLRSEYDTKNKTFKIGMKL